MTGQASPEAGRRFRRAAALLIHWRSSDSVNSEGVVAILREVEDDDERDGAAMAGLVCALARLAWQMAKAPDEDAAAEYVRQILSQAALDEARVADT